MIKLLSCSVILLFIFTSANAQNYCIQFSKEGKKTALIKEGRNISFIFSRTENWRKGKLVKITYDSLFLEQPITSKDILTERESNYMTKGYELRDFRIMAYNNTVKAVGKGSTAILYVAMMAVSFSYGGVYAYDDKEKTNHKKKFFKNNVDFDEGWEATIVLCE